MRENQMRQNPFEVLGLPADPGLGDEQVRAAWRQIASATHPDRADGGDLARYTAASAAYAELRTPWGRGEAYADLAELSGLPGPSGLSGPSRPGSGDEPVTAPLPLVPGEDPPRPVPPWQPLIAALQLPARIRRGRPRRLLIRAAITATLSLVVLKLIPGQPAAPADIGGLIGWFVLTGRKDLAPGPAVSYSPRPRVTAKAKARALVRAGRG
jgi:hypothetical protein